MLYGKHFKRRKDSKISSIEGNSMDYLGNREWQNILDNLGQSKNKLYSLSKGSGGLSKDNDHQGIPKDRETHNGKLNQDFCVICGINDVSDTGNQVCVQCRSKLNSMAPTKGLDFLCLKL